MLWRAKIYLVIKQWFQITSEAELTTLTEKKLVFTRCTLQDDTVYMQSCFRNIYEHVYSPGR